MAEVQLLKVSTVGPGAGTLTQHTPTSDSVRFVSLGIGQAAPADGIAITGPQVGGILTTPITANYSVTSTDFVIPIGTLTGTITITLPGSPTQGRVLHIKDGGGTAGTYPVSIAGNGNNIDGSSSFSLSVSRMSLTLVYHSTLGWLII